MRQGLRGPSAWRRCQPAVARPGTGRFRGRPAIRSRTRRDGISCRRDASGKHSSARAQIQGAPSPRMTLRSASAKRRRSASRHTRWAKGEGSRSVSRSFRFNGTGSCQGGYAAQVSLGVLTSVSRTSAAAADPCRLARHLAAGNAVTVRSTARRLNSLPLVGAEPLARAASAFARRRSQSILGDVL